MTTSQSQDSSLLEMLQAGVHFGHKTAKRHPKMSPYIFGVRQGISIINLERTKEQLDIALALLEELAAQNKTVLFLGTKRQAQTIVKEAAVKADVPYIVERWIGGLLTNFESVGGLMRNLTKLKKERDEGQWEQRYTKKERLEFEREIEKLEHLIGGVEKMEKKPDAMFIVDCKKEKTAIQEAKRMNIPVFAMVDTNVNPRDIKYVIPANDDGVKSIAFIVNQVAAAIISGKKRAPAVAGKEADTENHAKQPEVKPTEKKDN